MVDAIEHFSPNLVGQPFIVETDHKALTFLHSARHLNSRMARSQGWRIQMQMLSHDRLGILWSDIYVYVLLNV